MEFRKISLSEGQDTTSKYSSAMIEDEVDISDTGLRCSKYLALTGHARKVSLFVWK